MNYIRVISDFYQKIYIRHLYLSSVRELLQVPIYTINRSKGLTCPININF